MNNTSKQIAVLGLRSQDTECKGDACQVGGMMMLRGCGLSQTCRVHDRRLGVVECTF